jgi:methenyltetrahydrofolate cyclohydrolase
MNTESPDNRTVSEYLAALRSGAPTPGGGSAAALAGSLGAALLAMVCRLTLHRANLETSESLESVTQELDELVVSLSAAAREDEAVYGQYRAASSMPRSTAEEKQIRSAALQTALTAAADTPLAAASLGLKAIKLGESVARLGSPHALSDVETGRLLLDASIQGALTFVDVNVALIKDQATADARRRRAADIRHQASQGTKDIWKVLAARK